MVRHKKDKQDLYGGETEVENEHTTYTWCKSLISSITQNMIL